MRYPRITSLSNPLVREALTIRERNRKQGDGSFLVEGLHLVEMALSTSAELKRVFVVEPFLSKKEGQRLLRRILRKTSEAAEAGRGQGSREPLVVEVSSPILSRLCDTETPQGIVAVVACKHGGIEEISLRDIPLLVICDGVQDPGNLGTIIRVSDAAGADGVVVLPGTCDVFMPKTVRATAGSIFTIPVVQADHGTLLGYLQSSVIPLYATDIRGTVSLFSGDFRGPAAIAFGNEARGVGEQVRAEAKSLLRIPIIGKAESLNVAMAASVCLYEVVRQRMFSR